MICYGPWSRDLTAVIGLPMDSTAVTGFIGSGCGIWKTRLLIE
jgi:hypothetical protein